MGVLTSVRESLRSAGGTAQQRRKWLVREQLVALRSRGILILNRFKVVNFSQSAPTCDGYQGSCHSHYPTPLSVRRIRERSARQMAVYTHYAIHI